MTSCVLPYLSSDDSKMKRVPETIVEVEQPRHKGNYLLLLFLLELTYSVQMCPLFTYVATTYLYLDKL